MAWFRHLFEAAWKLSPEQRRRTVRWALGLAGVVLLVVLFAAGRTATTDAPAENPVWEVVILYRLALARLVLVLALLPAAVAAAVLIYQTLENSNLGKRLLIWSQSDTQPLEAISVQAAKTRNGGVILAVLLGGCIVGVLLGVLR